MKNKIEVITMSRVHRGLIPWTKTEVSKEFCTRDINNVGAFEGVPALSSTGILKMLHIFNPNPDEGNPPVSAATYREVEEIMYLMCDIADELDGMWHMTQLTITDLDVNEYRILKLYRVTDMATQRLEIGLSGEYEIQLRDIFTSTNMALMVQQHKPL